MKEIDRVRDTEEKVCGHFRQVGLGGAPCGGSTGEKLSNRQEPPRGHGKGLTGGGSSKYEGLEAGGAEEV